MKEMISVEEARAIIARETDQLVESVQRTDDIARASALGRVLASDVRAPNDIPPFANSAMDGFAVRAADVERVPVRLEVVGEVRAGEGFDGAVAPGRCVRIMTGATIPLGADAVVPVEWTSAVEPDRVEIGVSPGQGHHIRPAGGDVRKGSVVLEAGISVTPPVVGMLAAMGVTSVRVFSRPVVAVVATGNELAEDDASLGPGMIRNSNGPGLVAQARAAGAEILFEGVARDDEASTRAAIERGLDADVLLVSGGVSVGSHDHVRPVLDELGVDLKFWRVRQRPGKPLVFGTTACALVFGLPGNPVSSAVCFEQYVRPVLLRLQGDARPRRCLTATLSEAVDKKADLHYFARGAVTRGAAGLQVVVSGDQGSNICTTMVRSNCIVHLPEGRVRVESGEPVQIDPYSWVGADLEPTSVAHYSGHAE